MWRIIRKSKLLLLGICFQFLLFSLFSFAAMQARAANRSEDGFVIEADRVVGSGMTANIIRQETASSDAKPMLRIHYKKATIYGMKLTKQIESANGPVSITLVAKGPVTVTGMTVDTTALSFQGACLQADTPVPETGMDKIVMVAHYMNADNSIIQQLVLNTAAGRAGTAKPSTLKIIEQLSGLPANQLDSEIKKISEGHMPLTCDQVSEGNGTGNGGLLGNGNPLVDPVGNLVNPVIGLTQPLVPVLSPLQPVLSPLRPVLQPLDPVLGRLWPVVEPLDPVLGTVLPVVLEPLSPVLEPFDPVLKRLWPFVGPLDPVLGRLWPVVEPLDPVLGRLWPVAGPLWPVLSPVSTAFHPIVTALGPVASPLNPVLNPVTQLAAKSLEPAGNQLEQATRPLSPVTQQTGKAVKAVEPAVKPLEKVTKPAAEQTAAVIDQVGKQAGQATAAIPSAPSAQPAPVSTGTTVQQGGTAAPQPAQPQTVCDQVTNAGGVVTKELALSLIDSAAKDNVPLAEVCKNNQSLTSELNTWQNSLLQSLGLVNLFGQPLLTNPLDQLAKMRAQIAAEKDGAIVFDPRK